MQSKLKIWTHCRESGCRHGEDLQALPWEQLRAASGPCSFSHRECSVAVSEIRNASLLCALTHSVVITVRLINEPDFFGEL
jgi:hypothetical protein